MRCEEIYCAQFDNKTGLCKQVNLRCKDRVDGFINGMIEIRQYLERSLMWENAGNEPNAKEILEKMNKVFSAYDLK